MKRRNTFLAIALLLSALWLAAGASWLVREPQGVIAEHLRTREDICERRGLTNADRATCQARLRIDTDRLQSFQSDLRGDSLKVALLILVLIWSSGASLGLLLSAAGAWHQARSRAGPGESA